MARVCMSSYTQIGKMRNQKVFRFLLLYNILETVYRVVQATDGRTQGFVQTEGELSHFVDENVFQLPEYIKAEDVSAVSFTSLEEENLNTYASPVSFQPAMLNFNTQPVGMPHMERVIVRNLSPDTSIHMLSISGNTLHLYCSFFQEKVILPGGNTSFDVVFLARQEGPVENTLFIHTSLGSFKYQVTATGILNPYRLRPFIGVRMPLNSSYTPIIHMHNPHSSTLQLTEMYTSGGDLHLELPDGEHEASKNVWEIPPYETKPIIKANFIARVEKNHTAFIRIRTNGSQPDYLVLPVEVDVTSVPGIYSPTEVLDFGILRSHDPPKVLSLSLLNSGQKHIHIVNVIVTPVNEAVDVKFIPVKVPPVTVFSTQIATVTFNPAKAFHQKQCSGKIVVKSKNNQFKLHIPYQVHLIRGSLDFNKSSTRFYVGSELKSNKIDIRKLNITNNFNVTIIIYNLSLPEEAKPHFKVSIQQPVVLIPGETLSAIWLTFQPSHKNLQLTTYLRLHTNISYFDVPLLCFSGRLKVFLPHAVNESIIDFGTLGMGDKRTMIFAVINENPVDVNLKLWGSNASKSYVELVGIDKGNASTLVWRHNFSSMAHSLTLKPHHYAIFRIGITAPLQEGILSGHAFVETQHEKINIPFSLRTAKGGLKVEEVFFGNSFPGKISTLNFYVHSSFSHSMTVTGVTTIPDDPRFSFDPLKHAPAVLYPNSRNLVGKVHFDLRKHCKQKCYSGLPTTTSMGHQWLLGMSLPPDVADMDRELFKTLHSRWKKLVDLEGKSLNMTLNLDTTEVRGHVIKASALFHWPRLFSKHSLKFPITQIGNCTIKDFTLENPSSLPLIVQVAPLSLYPKTSEVTNLLSEKLGGKLTNLKHMTTDPDVFTLEDLEENNSPENHIPAYRKSVEEYFGIQSHKQSVVILLTPGMRVRIHVAFKPKDELLQSSLILIRNNLTVLDAFLVQGQGGHGEIKFGNLSPGSDSSLNFELTDKHLKDCDGTKTSKFSTPNFTVRKPFTARNTGPLPIYIQGFDISGKPCEAYGFRVLNCEGFELKPNESKRVDIAFTPDFTLTRVERLLNIHTSSDPNGHSLKFVLVSTIPRHMLAYCSETLPRPFWELFVYYSFNLLTTVLIFGLLIFAHLDSQKLLKSSYFPVATIGIHPDKSEKGNVFDLKALASSNLDSNSSVKVINCRPVDLKKGNSQQKNASSETVSSSSSSSSSSSTSSSHKKTINLSLPKNRDLSSVKDFEENFMENGTRHSKKKATKLRQQNENYVLEPEFVEIRKSQPRNSWTRFLKPPFSFNTAPPAQNKPSVATQTSNDETEDNTALKVEPDILSEEVVTCEDNDVKNQAKTKKDIKYIESKGAPKRNIESLPEEETSSTTTETSTAESDISEKDHQLPDVCVTAKVPKSRISKNKNRDRNSHKEAVTVTKPPVEAATDGEGFELSTKSRGHKKIKVDPNKVFGGDILQPSTLELPYKPKPVIGEQKKDECCSSDDSRTSYNTTPHSSEKVKVSYHRRNNEKQSRKVLRFSVDKCNKNFSSYERNGDSSTIWHCSTVSHWADPFNEFPHQNNNFGLRQGPQHNAWPNSSPTESTSPLSSRTGNYSESPTSYSAVLSRDIAMKNVDKTTCDSGRENEYKTPVGHRPASNQSQSKCNYLGHNTPPLSAFNSVSPSSPAFATSRTNNDFSSSKLKHWISHRNTAPSTDNSKRTSNVNDAFGPALNSIWSTQPLESTPSFSADRKNRSFQKQQDVGGDWSGFEPLAPESVWDSKAADTLWSVEDDQMMDSMFKQPDVMSSTMWTTVASSWDNSSNVWSYPSQDNTVSPVGTSVAVPKSRDLENSGEEINSGFNPFQTLSNLWITQLNTSEETNLSESASSNKNSGWSFSLFSEPASPAISDSSQVHDHKEEETKDNTPDPSN